MPPFTFLDQRFITPPAPEEREEKWRTLRLELVHATLAETELQKCGRFLTTDKLEELAEYRNRAAKTGLSSLPHCPLCGSPPVSALWYIKGINYDPGIRLNEDALSAAVLRYGCKCDDRNDPYGAGVDVRDTYYLWPPYTKLATEADRGGAKDFWEKTVCAKRDELEQRKKRRYSPLAEAIAEALVAAVSPYLQQK